jgi:hypothetical protein
MHNGTLYHMRERLFQFNHLGPIFIISQWKAIILLCIAFFTSIESDVNLLA